jgi:small subunit ribosomal protein S19
MGLLSLGRRFESYKMYIDSKYKMKNPVYVAPQFYYNILKLNKKTKKQKFEEKINLYNRNTTLIPICLGRLLYVHNGKTFLKVSVSENIIGHKLGEFSRTRRPYFYKKIKSKNIKNIKKRK